MGRRWGFGTVKKQPVLAFYFIMVCRASEQAMSQWASAFAESGLNVKDSGRSGRAFVVILLGISRAMYEIQPAHPSHRLYDRQRRFVHFQLCAGVHCRSPFWDRLRRAGFPWVSCGREHSRALSCPGQPCLPASGTWDVPVVGAGGTHSRGIGR